MNANCHSAYLFGLSKRCLDLVICLLITIPAALIILVSSILILLLDGKPIFFYQERIGTGGGNFIMPKLRTLKIHANPNLPACSYNTDALVTRTGRFLRKYRIDELPQVFCVVTGTMSFVGPRPELPDIVSKYNPKEFKRVLARPGLTGLWQIKAPHNQPIHKNIKYDFYYLKKASIWLDIKVLAATMIFLIRE